MTKKNKELDILQSNVREVLKTGAGKELIWYMLEICDIYNDYNIADTNRVNYMLGRRSIGLELLQLIEDANPGSYSKLLNERMK